MKSLVCLPSFVALILCLAVGCSGGKAKKYKVSGKLTRGGAPLKPKETGQPMPPSAGGDHRVRLAFYPIEEGKPRGDNPASSNADAKYAKLNADGTFEVTGGLAPGKYVAVVSVRGGGPQTPDELEEKYSFRNSQIIVEISGDKTDLDIDLDKYK